MTINNILILGYGKIGSLLAEILSNLNYKISVIDQIEQKSKFDFFALDLKNTEEIKAITKKQKIDTIISCLPFSINKNIASLCREENLNYFDPTEDVETTQYIKELAQGSNNIFMPQNGLAPGFIGILGHHLVSLCDNEKADQLRLRVGALPEHPIGSLGYSCNWSIDGLINEYIESSEIVENHQIIQTPSLERDEIIKINGNDYEAFLTSGGVGTLLESLKENVANINYKTIRYRGHLERIKFLFHELKLKTNRKLLKEIFLNAMPPNDSDRVLVHASVTGKFSSNLKTLEYTADYPPKELFGKTYTAIAWTTAGSIAAVIELFSTGKIEDRGFVELDKVKLEDFLNTQMGKYFITDKIKI